MIHESPDFIAVTNHDTKVEEWNRETWEEALKHEPDVAGIHTLLFDSIDRKKCVARMFRSATRRHRSPDLADVIRWVTTQPVLNETTHFSCIMDPARGVLVWARAYATAVDMDESSSEW